MTEKQYLVETAKRHLANAESLVQEAQVNLDSGRSSGSLKMKQAESERNRECGRLVEELRRAGNNLNAEKAFLQKVEADNERGFDK